MSKSCVFWNFRENPFSQSITVVNVWWLKHTETAVQGFTPVFTGSNIVGSWDYLLSEAKFLSVSTFALFCCSREAKMVQYLVSMGQTESLWVLFPAHLSSLSPPAILLVHFHLFLKASTPSVSGSVSRSIRWFKLSGLKKKSYMESERFKQIDQILTGSASL